MSAARLGLFGCRKRYDALLRKIGELGKAGGSGGVGGEIGGRCGQGFNQVLERPDVAAGLGEAKNMALGGVCSPGM